MRNEESKPHQKTAFSAEQSCNKRVTKVGQLKINEGVATDKIATSLRAEKQARQAVRITKPSGESIAQGELKVNENSCSFSQRIARWMKTAILQTRP